VKGMKKMPRSGGKNEKNRFCKLYFIVLTLVILACDQFSKSWIMRQFDPGESLPLINGLFHLTFVKNPGAAFGILAFRTSFFIIVSLLMIFLIIFGGRFFPQENFLRLSMALLLGGAVGNLIDRMRYGYVVDFLDFRIWPVFNIADISLVVGIFFFIYALYKNRFFLNNNGL